ncbi:MAG: DMT family transporter [Bdellovibrionota bacterium]
MRHQGIVQILLSGFCFGFLGLFGKRAFALGLSPGEFLAWRFLLAAVVLGLLLRSRLAIGRGPALRALLLGCCGYALFSTCYFLALQGLSVALTVLLLYTYPLWVTLGARIFFGERLGRAQWALFPVLLGGLVLLLWGEFAARDPLYLGFGLLSSIFYSAYILCSRRWLRGVPPMASSFYVMLGAALVLGAIHLRSRPAGAEVWLVLGATAMISTILAISLFLSALQKLTGAEVSLLSLGEPVTAVLLGVLALHESLSQMQWLGAFSVLAALVALSLVSAVPLEIPAGSPDP